MTVPRSYGSQERAAAARYREGGWRWLADARRNGGRKRSVSFARVFADMSFCVVEESLIRFSASRSWRSALRLMSARRVDATAPTPCLLDPAPQIAVLASALMGRPCLRSGRIAIQAARERGPLRRYSG